MFPNPATNNIFITSLTVGDRIVVSNTLGQNIYDNICYKADLSLDISAWSSGVYFVSVVSPSAASKQGILVKR